MWSVFLWLKKKNEVAENANTVFRNDFIDETFWNGFSNRTGCGNTNGRSSSRKWPSPLRRLPILAFCIQLRGVDLYKVVIYYIHFFFLQFSMHYLTVTSLQLYYIAISIRTQRVQKVIISHILKDANCVTAVGCCSFWNIPRILFGKLRDTPPPRRMVLMRPSRYL